MNVTKTQGYAEKLKKPYGHFQEEKKFAGSPVNPNN